MTDYEMEVEFIIRNEALEICTGRFHFSRLCDVIAAVGNFVGDADVSSVKITKGEWSEQDAIENGWNRRVNE